ncbi:MAG: lipoprotein insertase outer membrane protein LolB [Gammaproteobacteria bacterium]
MTGVSGWKATGPSRRALLSASLLILAGCASQKAVRTDDRTAAWSGRMALQVDGDPPQSFHAAFELTGQPSRGELRLTSPLGTLLALVQWSDDGATLTQGSQVTRHSSVEDLVSTLGGAPIPVTALFDWLQARPANVTGWMADLSRQPEGRIVARREHPQPLVILRIILDP